MHKPCTERARAEQTFLYTAQIITMRQININQGRYLQASARMTASTEFNIAFYTYPIHPTVDQDSLKTTSYDNKEKTHWSRFPCIIFLHIIFSQNERTYSYILIINCLPSASGDLRARPAHRRLPNISWAFQKLRQIYPEAIIGSSITRLSQH